MAGALSFADRNQDGQGAGWTAANSVFWQCAAGRIDCYAPPTAMNWAFGSWSEFAGNGYWNESNNHIEPRSLYYSQLAERIKTNVTESAHLLEVGTEASSNLATRNCRIADFVIGKAGYTPYRLDRRHDSRPGPQYIGKRYTLH